MHIYKLSSLSTVLRLVKEKHHENQEFIYIERRKLIYSDLKIVNLSRKWPSNATQMIMWRRKLYTRYIGLGRDIFRRRGRYIYKRNTASFRILQISESFNGSLRLSRPPGVEEKIVIGYPVFIACILGDGRNNIRLKPRNNEISVHNIKGLYADGQRVGGGGEVLHMVPTFSSQVLSPSELTSRIYSAKRRPVLDQKFLGRGVLGISADRTSLIPPTFQLTFRPDKNNERPSRSSGTDSGPSRRMSESKKHPIQFRGTPVDVKDKEERLLS